MAAALACVVLGAMLEQATPELYGVGRALSDDYSSGFESGSGSGYGSGEFPNPPPRPPPLVVVSPSTSSPPPPRGTPTPRIPIISSPPPSPVVPPGAPGAQSFIRYVVVITLIASGNINDYTPAILGEMGQLLAAKANVSSTAASLSVIAASVVIIARIIMASESAMNEAQIGLASELRTAQTATAFFSTVANGNVTIIYTPLIEAATERLVYQPPPPSPSDDGGLSSGVLVGVTVGPGIAVLVGCCFAFYYFIYEPQTAPPKKTPTTAVKKKGSDSESEASTGTRGDSSRGVERSLSRGECTADRGKNRQIAHV
ncbi:hypothetical protein AB1Y20_012777 [Prymnesium parvum]|uniref:H(+)-exporting diphosphatase n=1 Tax=Prymnesium parvum TaxID=97485 RepID=A0AB34IIT6_PRYPA